MKRLNVFSYGMRKGKSIRILFSNIKHFFINIKYAFQRATKGYCDWDVSDLDVFYIELFKESLKHFAKHTYSYPGDMKDFTDWKDELDKMIYLFSHSRDDDFENEYFEEWQNSQSKLEQERKEIAQKYLDKEKENYELAEKNKDEAMDMLKKYLYDLWW